METIKTCCFTGHRFQKLPFGANEQDARCLKLKEILKAEIAKQITENEVSHFISGMAIGIDMFAAEIVLELKAAYPHITLEAAIPCETQAIKWSEQLRNRYFDIVEKCDKETLIQKHYEPGCMNRRNRYMVDHSDIVIAVWDSRPSGTGNTVKYAKGQNKPVIIINPTTLDITN